MNFGKATLLSFLIAMPITAQELNIDANRGNTWKNFTYDMESVFGGIGYSYSRPFHWKGKQWGHLGMLTAGTAALFLVDEEVDQWANGFDDDVPQWILDYGNEYGSPENNYAITGAVYLAGLFTKNEKLRRTGVLLISSATASGFLQQVTKRIIGRARPKSGETSFTFDPFHVDRVFNFDSFPSGHAMLAFTNAYAISKQFSNPWIKAGIYTVGMIPGMVRVIDDFHWISDVAFSTVVSIFIVESIDKYLDRRYNEKYNSKKDKMDFSLNFGMNRVGVALRF